MYSRLLHHRILNYDRIHVCIHTKLLKNLLFKLCKLTHIQPFQDQLESMGANYSKEWWGPWKALSQWFAIFPQPWGLSLLINDGGLPPSSKPDAQCWFTPLNDPCQLLMIKRSQYTIDDYPNDLYCMRKCGHCNKQQSLAWDADREKDELFKTCARCQNSHYCSESCQMLDWHKHKTVCKDAANHSS